MSDGLKRSGAPLDPPIFTDGSLGLLRVAWDRTQSSETLSRLATSADGKQSLNCHGILLSAITQAQGFRF